jgi:opacity protein-like surface antigen
LIKYRASDQYPVLALGYSVTVLPSHYVSLIASKATTTTSDVVLGYIKDTSGAALGFHYLQVNGTAVPFQTRIAISQTNYECAAIHVESTYSTYGLLFSSTSVAGGEYLLYKMQFLSNETFI